jgi:hypothetical protein
MGPWSQAEPWQGVRRSRQGRASAGRADRQGVRRQSRTRTEGPACSGPAALPSGGACLVGRAGAAGTAVPKRMPPSTPRCGLAAGRGVRRPGIPCTRPAPPPTCAGAMVMPSAGRSTRPYCSICCTRPRTLSMGMAQPTPEKEPLPLGSTTPTLTPTTRPCRREGAWGWAGWAVTAGDALVLALSVPGGRAHAEAARRWRLAGLARLPAHPLTHLAVQQHAARVARVDGRVRLDDVLDGEEPRGQLPPQPADDALRRRAVAQVGRRRQGPRAGPPRERAGLRGCLNARACWPAPAQHHF